MADRQYLVPINLNGLALNNASLQPLGTAPASPAVARMYFDTTALAPRWWDGTAWTNVATNSAALNGQNAAYYLNRSNHTGTQTSATISDLATTVQAYRLDQFAAPTAPVSFNSQRITNVAAPAASTDGANRQYVDDKVAGLSWKDEVRVATTAAGTLASSFANGSAIDGVTLATGDRILIKDQANQTENGLYTVNASGAPTRATDADTGAEIDGAAVFVANGTTNAGTRWVSNTTGTITLGTTNITFVSFGGGSSYTNGNGIALSGNVFSFLPASGGGLTVSGSGAAIDTTVVVRKFAQDVGDGSATSIAVTHGLGTKDVTVQVFANASPFSQVECDVQHTSTTVTTLVFATAPASAALRFVAHG